MELKVHACSPHDFNDLIYTMRHARTRAATAENLIFVYVYVRRTGMSALSMRATKARAALGKLPLRWTGGLDCWSTATSDPRITMN